MSESAPVPLVVVSSARDPVEALNSLLRRQGIAARCSWVAALKDLPDALTQHEPHLLLCLPQDGIDVGAVATVRTRSLPDLPLLAVRSELTEETLDADLVAGANDTINLAQPERAHRVIARELRLRRLQRTCDEAQDAVEESRKQLDHVLTRSNDAIIDVQEGILVEANRSWLDLVGASSVDSVLGHPIMDAFEPESHVALKGALSACLKGRWTDHALQVKARNTRGSSIPLELLLTLGERDGEPCVRIMVPIKPQVTPAPTAAAAVRPAAPAPAAAAGTKPPPPASAPSRPAAAQPAPPAAKPPPATTAPAPPPAATSPPASPAAAASDAHAYDGVWVKHIKAALAENRFRLVQQPITSLAGGAPMYDMLVRMLDRSRKEILPREFMPPAERNRLLGAIDRWVIGAAARFAADGKHGCLFLRLSQQSALDGELPQWLSGQLGGGLKPAGLCLQVTEAVATQHLDAVRKQATAVKKLGLRFALEHFGAGPDPLSMLSALPMDFVKIDGTLIHGVKSDSLVQSKIEALVEAARERGIETIAEQVEDANTMAVLWQLGVQHLEGFLIQAPEEVVLA